MNSISENARKTKIHLLLPKGIKEILISKADDIGISTNQLIVRAIKTQYCQNQKSAQKRD